MRAHILRRFLLLAAVLFALLAAGCENAAVTKAPPTSGGIEIDPVFREFYDRLGGEEVMGVAISQAFYGSTTVEQYTAAGLMRYDKLAPTAQQFQLVPLGSRLNIHDAPIGVPAQEGLRVEDGFVIYKKFVELYDQLDRSRFAGAPLSQPRFEPDKDRVVQYFKNLGFYTSLANPDDGVHLLAYGAMACDEGCRYQPGSREKVLPQPAFSQPFLNSLARLGPDFVGQPISDYYRAPDGMIEQVYENAVIYAPPDNLSQISLRPLPGMMGFTETGLVAPIIDPRMIFKPVQGEMGHNVAVIFDQFIAARGGVFLSGLPTTEMFTADGEYRQCFTNYCLDYDPAAPEERRIHLAPLGRIYLAQFPPEGPAEEMIDLKPELIFLNAWEEQTILPGTQPQKVYVSVLQMGDRTPIPNIGATIIVTLPDGRNVTYEMPATDEDGTAFILLDAIPARSGTMIPYKVCLAVASAEPLCKQDAYMIWNDN